MKKKTQIESGIIKEETVKGVEFSGDSDIIRVTHNDGTVTYRHPMSSGEEPTYSYDLEEALTDPLHRIQSLIDLLGVEDYERFGVIAEAVAAHALQTCEEISHFIQGQVGDVRIDYMSSGGRGGVYRRGRVLGVRISPNTPVVEEAKEV